MENPLFLMYFHCDGLFSAWILNFGACPAKVGQFWGKNLATDVSKKSILWLFPPLDKMQLCAPEWHRYFCLATWRCVSKTQQ
ncbi:hypothetical protein FKM82_017697 [Ascaphus truei]